MGMVSRFPLAATLIYVMHILKSDCLIKTENTVLFCFLNQSELVLRHFGCHLKSSQCMDISFKHMSRGF